MLKNQNLQESGLFDDSISCINTSSNNSNTVHKQFATSTSPNNSKNKPNTKFLYFCSIPQSHDNFVRLYF